MKIQNLFAAAVLSVSTSAFAIPISTTGGLDQYIQGANIGNSDASETQFFADYLGVSTSDVTYSKYDVGGSAWELVDGTTSTYAFDFGTDLVELFLVKMGGGQGVFYGGGSTSYTHFLYNNNGAGGSQYAVIDLSPFTTVTGQGKVKGIDIFRVSHTGVSLGDSVQVPEPSILALLGLGMFGVGVARKFKK